MGGKGGKGGKRTKRHEEGKGERRALRKAVEYQQKKIKDNVDVCTVINCNLFLQKYAFQLHMPQNV